MKFASQVLLFGQDKWIWKYLENTYPHVENIYITYSELPWTYNQYARVNYINTTKLNIIDEILDSKYGDKVVIIYGKWDTEEDQRNACISSALTNDIDYLFVHDADEFFYYNDFLKIKTVIEQNPNKDYYTTQSKTFWKSFDYIILNINKGELTGAAPVVLNIRNGTVFQRKRTPNKQTFIQVPDVVFYHGSYVLNDSEMLVKLKTWGHASDFDTDSWYRNIWLNWEEGKTKDLHPLMPHAWPEAIKYNGELPI